MGLDVEEISVHVWVCINIVERFGRTENEFNPSSFK